MSNAQYSVQLRKFNCHPETCAHDDHSPWWLWDEKGCYWYLGFDSKTDAIDFCVRMGYTYVLPEAILASCDAF